MEAYLLRATFYLLLGEHVNAMSDFESVIENKVADVKVSTYCETIVKIYEYVDF